MARIARLVTLVGSLALVACASRDRTGSGDDAIIGGVPATDYPEAALIGFTKGDQSFICSGAVIAPKVVLTAGHCVNGAANWFVTAGGVTTFASSATVFDYVETGEFLNLSQHDIGLVFLADAITLPRYPTIANVPVATGSNVVNVGRIQDGVDKGGLFERATTVELTPIGQPFDYGSEMIIQPGDSGGPDFVAGTHLIVAVNSGTQNAQNTQSLARVDLVHDFIIDQINAHGGGGAAAQGVIPNDTLTSVGRYEVVAEQLNCRSGPGTANPVAQQLFSGTIVQATEGFFRPRIAAAPDGNPWLLVQPPSGDACYVSANFAFIAPDPEAPDGRLPGTQDVVVAPGLYGSLALAVHGSVVTGSIHEGACEVTLAGKTSTRNPIDLSVFTSGGARSAAQLTVVDGANVTLRAADLPGACAGIFDPQIAIGGATLSFRAAISPNVFGFRTIAAAKAFFHDGPASPPRSSFVIKGQTVQQLGENDGGFVKVRFSSASGTLTTGFLAEADLVDLGFGVNGAL